MKIISNKFMTDDEFTLTQKIGRLEKRLLGLERALLYAIGLTFVFRASEFILHLVIYKMLFTS